MSTNGGSSGNGSKPTRNKPAHVFTGETLIKPKEALQEGELGLPVDAKIDWNMFGAQDPSTVGGLDGEEVTLSDLKRMTRTDGHARSLLQILSLPLRAAHRAMDPVKDGEKEAEFCENMLSLAPHQGGMTTPFGYVMACHALAFRDGFAVFEKVAQVIDGTMTLRKLSPRPANTIEFKYDDHGGFGGVVQSVAWKNESRRVEIPPEKCLLFTVGKEESPLSGESLFLPAYYHYDKKHRLYYIAHVAAQAVATGIRVGTVPAGRESTINAFRDILQGLALNGTAVKAQGYEVEVQAVTSDLSGILSWAEHHDISMSKSILSHFLDIGTEGKGGLGTATTTSELGNLFRVAISSHLDDVAAGFNSYVFPWFVEANFASGRSPIMRFEQIDEDSEAALVDVFKSIYSPTAQPDGELMVRLEKSVADAFGIDGIDWDKKMEEAKEEVESKAEMRSLLASNPPPALPPSQTPADGSGSPAPSSTPPPANQPRQIGSGVSLEEVRAAAEAAVRLAEASTKDRVFIDSIGQRCELGDLVFLDADEEQALYSVRAVIDGAVTIVSEDDESVRAAQPTELIRV